MRRAEKTLILIGIASVMLIGCLRQGGGPQSLPDGPAIDFGPAEIDKYSENPITADSAYKGKKVRVRGEIEEFAEKDGRPILAFHRRPGQMIGLHTSRIARVGPESAPQVLCIFDDKPTAIASLKRGDLCAVEGVLAGRVDDGIVRNEEGHGFHIRVERCRLVEVPSAGKK